MLGIILIIIGIISIILGITFFAKKAFWILIGIILAIVGVYFLFFATAPVDTGNGLMPGVGPDPADFDQTDNEIELVSLHGFVLNYYECGFGKTCIDVSDEEGNQVSIVTEIEIDLEGVVEIDAFGHFNNSIFVADNIVLITTLEGSE